MENKNNSAVLFKNESKTENAPNYKGKIVLNDYEYHLSAWVKKAKSGISYMSLSVGEQVVAKVEKAPVKSAPIEDDDLPFQY